MSLETKTTEQERVNRFVDLVWKGKQEEARAYYKEYIEGKYELRYCEKILLAQRVLNCKC